MDGYEFESIEDKGEVAAAHETAPQLQRRPPFDLSPRAPCGSLPLTTTPSQTDVDSDGATGGMEDDSRPGTPSPPSPSGTPSAPPSPSGARPDTPSSSNPNGSRLAAVYNGRELTALAKLGQMHLFGASQRAEIEQTGSTPRNPLVNGVERGDKVVFVHEYAKGKDADGIGREFCRDVQGLRREVRGLLFGGIYIEYDIINCQYGLALSSLRNYYFNRDSMINVLGETTVWRRAGTDVKACAKELVMRLSFGGAINTFETDNDCSLAGQGKVFAEGVKRDMDELKGCFCNDTALYEYYKARDLKEPKSAHEHLRRLSALLLQDVEYNAAEKAISDQLGLVTGVRIFDALLVEKHALSEDLVKKTLADAANEAVNSLFPQQGAILFEPTPLSFSSKLLVATTSLSDFVYRETGFIMNELEDLPEIVQKGDDVGFYRCFCDDKSSQLVKDSKKQDPDGGLWQLVDVKDPPPALAMAVRQFALDQEARDSELSLKRGKALCGSHSWQAYHSAMRIYVRNLGQEMWHGNNPNNSDIALLDKLYDWQNHTVRSYNKDDYYASSLTIDYQAWDEQDPDECDEELNKQYEGFFEDEVAKDRVLDRIAVAVVMCTGNFRKKALVLKGKGGNGKSALVSSLKHT
ncbi:hypothetical protein T492DRAFT_879316, partial [Pavlovales sp. CCMP2436]